MRKLIYIFLFIPFTLAGQRYVSGKITDAENHDPVPGASVFLSNTTIGAFTDAKGYYQLQIPEGGSYRLTVSHAAYKPVFKDIEPGNSAVEFNAALHIYELKEVTVTKKVRFRQKDIDLFWKTILGKSPSPKAIQITNPQAVYYYYNPETRVLRVTCREPLQIVNYETGYQINYILDYFTHDYNNDNSDWSNHFIFTELKPENSKQKNNWEKKRQKVYDISLTKFIKSLYNNSLYDNGFVLATLSQNPNSGLPYQISLINTDSILSEKSADNGKTLHLSNNEQAILICYGRPVTAHDLDMIQQKSREFTNDKNLFMNLFRGDSIQIFPDGTYTNKLVMASVNSSKTLLALNMKLPLEYHPEVLAPNGNTSDFDDIVTYFDTQLRVFPQEKIHLHTDRDFYVPGEKIWFKAYLTDAATFQPLRYSRYVYVELIDLRDSLVNRVMIRPENNMYYGHLLLSKVVPEGNYTLRAYTRYMENLGDDYFFKKNIRIGNLASDKKQLTKTKTEQEKRKTQKTADDYDVSFFPEGGNLVEGVVCKVAFKALNRNGYSETLSGNIIDEQDSIIAPVQTIHAGMGAFIYFPAAGKRYFLKCRNENGLEKQFELPQPDPRACALTVSRRNKMLMVGVRKSAQSPKTPCYLLAHCRGQVFHFLLMDKENDFIAFPEESLPAGIIQFVLLDEQMNPLSERLAFNNNYDCAKAEFHTGSGMYKPREKVIATLSLTDSTLDVLSGNLSVAVTDDKDVAVDSTTTILSSLLLSSELKGYIENPAYYLQDNPESATALDYLMLTHGWRRYNIPDVVKGNYELPQIPVQTSQEISGMVKSGNRSKPVSGSEIIIMARDGNLGSASTDMNGAFTYQNFEYPDSTTYFIQASDKKGSRGVELVLNKESFPKLTHAPQSPILEIPVNKEKMSESESGAFMAKAEQRSKYDEDMRTIHLNEVVITGKKIEKKDEPRLQYWANSGSDETIRREDIERRNPQLVADMLRGVAGVWVSSNGYISIRGGGLPLVLIDGMSFEWPEKMKTLNESPVETVSIHDVESIDIFKGPSASIFGMRGANGAISITTRIGGSDEILENTAHNRALYTPLGYQKPVEFYSPKYETLDPNQLTIPDYRTTIFWKPDVVISDTGKASFEFYTSDFPTTYSVVIEGLTDEGKIIRQVAKIFVF